jgi:hypothetical protein
MSFGAIAFARHAGATLATLRRIFPWKRGMTLADPAKADTMRTVAFHRGSKARGPCSKHLRNTERRSGPLELGPHPGDAQKSLSFPDAVRPFRG